MIDALFGERGFLPESMSRLMYLAQDKAPILNAILDRIAPQRDRRKRQVRGSPRTRSCHMSQCHMLNIDCALRSQKTF